MLMYGTQHVERYPYLSYVTLVCVAFAAAPVRAAPPLSRLLHPPRQLYPDLLDTLYPPICFSLLHTPSGGLNNPKFTSRHVTALPHPVRLQPTHRL